MTHPIETIIANYNAKGLTLTPEQQARFDSMKELFDEGSLDLGTVILDTIDIIGEENRSCVPMSLIEQSVQELASEPDVETIAIKNGRIITPVESAENARNVKTIEELKHGDVFKMTMAAMTKAEEPQPIKTEVQETVPGVVEPVNIEQEQKDMVEQSTVEPVEPIETEEEHRLKVEEAAAEVIEQLAAGEDARFTVTVPTLVLDTVSAIKDESYKVVPVKFIERLEYDLSLSRNMVAQLGKWVDTEATVKDPDSVQLAYARVVKRLTDKTYNKESVERANAKIKQLNDQIDQLTAALKQANDDLESTKTNMTAALEKRKVVGCGLYVVQFEYNNKPAFVSGTDKTLQVSLDLSKARFYTLQGACDVLDYVIKHGEQFNIPETMLTTFKVRTVNLQDV